MSNQFPVDPNHSVRKIEEAIGKDIVCLDGVTRTVETITPSVGDFRMAIINSTQYFEGYQVNLVSLFSQLRGEGVPSKELLDVFEGIASTFTVEYEGQDPNKIYLPLMKNVRDFSKYKKNKKKRK